MSKRARLIWMTTVLSVVSICAVITGIRMFSHNRPSDTRAYDIDNNDVSLNEVLRRTGIQLPDCFNAGIKYAFVDEDFGYYREFYAKFQASETCVNNFLESNAMHDKAGLPRVGGVADVKLDPSDFSTAEEKVRRQLGWQLDPGQSFQAFGVNTAKFYHLGALIQHVPDSPMLIGYVSATPYG